MKEMMMAATKKKPAKKKPAKQTKCDCLKQVNEMLKKDNAELRTEFGLDLENRGVSTLGPYVAVRKLEKSRKSLVSLLCTYCPFCGKKISH